MGCCKVILKLFSITILSCAVLLVGASVFVMNNCHLYMIEASSWKALTSMCTQDNDFCRNIKVYSDIISKGFINYITQWNLNTSCQSLLRI